MYILIHTAKPLITLTEMCVFDRSELYKKNTHDFTNPRGLWVILQFTPMEAIIAKINCDISTLIGYYHAIRHIGPTGLFLGRVSPTPMCWKGIGTIHNAWQMIKRNINYSGFPMYKVWAELQEAGKMGQIGAKSHGCILSFIYGKMTHGFWQNSMCNGYVGE